MSQNEIVMYEQQCWQWHNDLLNDFEINNTYNLNERLDEIENIVNRECAEYCLFDYNYDFKIGPSQRNNLHTLCNKDLRAHTMVSYDKCTKQMNDIDDYKKKARNKLNRWKPKVFGEHVLYHIIFIDIYNHCWNIGRSNTSKWDDDVINQLFITIFIALLDGKIRFKKTRDVALILPTVFAANTRFKSSCMYFLEHFNEATSWKSKSGKAKDKRDSFRLCLQKIIQYKDIAIPPPIIVDMMDITEMDRYCIGAYSHLIRAMVIQMEEEEYMYDEERISGIHLIVDLINEYHHHALKFWTITPYKEHALLPVTTASTTDTNTAFIIIDDDDGDIDIPLHANDGYITALDRYEAPYDVHRLQSDVMYHNKMCSSVHTNTATGTATSSTTAFINDDDNDIAINYNSFDRTNHRYIKHIPDQAPYNPPHRYGTNTHMYPYPLTPVNSADTTRTRNSNYTLIRGNSAVSTLSGIESLPPLKDNGSNLFPIHSQEDTPYLHAQGTVCEGTLPRNPHITLPPPQIHSMPYSHHYDRINPHITLPPPPVALTNHYSNCFNGNRVEYNQRMMSYDNVTNHDHRRCCGVNCMRYARSYDGIHRIMNSNAPNVVSAPNTHYNGPSRMQLDSVPNIAFDGDHNMVYHNDVNRFNPQQRQVMSHRHYTVDNMY